MKFLKASILTVALFAFPGLPALAQTKIATVDMEKLFHDYYKTRLAQAAIQDHKNQLDKDDKSMRADLQKASDEYQKLLTQASDPAISDEERAKRQQAATAELKKLQERRAAIAQYEQTAQANMDDQIQQMRAKILAAIESTVNTVAQSGGYTLVVDKSAQSAGVTPVVVYADPKIDLTVQVLKELNAGAPIDLDTNSAPAASSAPSLLNPSGP